MRRTTMAIALAGAALALAFAAGTVLGGDGSNRLADRLAGGFGDPAVELARPLRHDGARARAARRRKPRVLHGVSGVADVAAGGTGAIALKCPRRFPVPLSAGLESSVPGIFPGAIARSTEVRRAMLVGVANTTDSDGQWRATIACMRGAKEA